MSINTYELDESGTIQVGEQHEVRTRVWIVESNNPVSDLLVSEAAVMRLAYQANSPLGLDIPRRDDRWEDHFHSDPTQPNDSASVGHPDGGTFSNPGGLILDTHEPIASEAADILRCVGINCQRLGPIHITKAAFKITATYSTQPSLYIVRRSFEISSVTERIYFDLDALTGECNLASNFSDCVSWQQVNTLPALADLTPAEKYALAQIGRTGGKPEGVDRLKPQLILTYRQHVILDGIVKILAIKGIANTLNACTYGDFGTVDEWLFLGLAAEQVRGRIFDVTAKFAFDQGHHRSTFWIEQPGTNTPASPAQTSVPPCRSYRRYGRADWSVLLGLFNFGGFFNVAQCTTGFFVNCPTILPPGFPPPPGGGGGPSTHGGGG